MGQTLDPVTLEVIQNRLTQIGWESGVVLTRAAASPVAVESKDLGFNIADHRARCLVYSVWMPRHGTTLSYMLQSSIQKFGADRIFPDDMIITNNPHAGALHVSDIAIIAPVHFEGELLAWVGCAMHHLDIGGMNPGWSPQARDWFQEGLKISPIKIIERGRVQNGIFDLFLDNVRLPEVQGHDLTAQIASCNFAKQKIAELAERYGIETLKAAYDQILDYTEAKTQRRIAELTPGHYHYRDQCEYDETFYRLNCTLEVTEDRLTFDFDGTDPEADAFINSAEPCSVANVHNIVTCMVFPDIPANEGMFRAIDVRFPQGTIFSCQPPAPCSGASIEAGWKAQTMATGALAQALRASSHAWRTTAVWGDSQGSVQLSGQNQYDRYYTILMMEGCMQGGGARRTKDGIDGSNIAGSTNTSIPNVETHEQKYPILYLSRGLLPDSEGAGQFRGGLGGEYAITPYGRPLSALPFYMGKHLPSKGIEGGYPGGTTEIRHYPAAHAFDHPEIWGQGGMNQEAGQSLSGNSAMLRLMPGEVLTVRCQGGGGIGDPLTRSPQMVANDVRAGRVRAFKAADVYGVELDRDGTVQEAKTRALRDRLRQRRRKSLTEVDTSRGWCEECRREVEMVTGSLAAEAFGAPIATHPRVHYRVALCSSCNACVDVDILVSEEASLAGV